MGSAYVAPRRASLGNRPPKPRLLLARVEPRTLIGLTMIIGGLFLLAMLLSSAVQSQALPQEGITETVQTTLGGQPGSGQPIIVNGRAVYAVPIVSGAIATAILQQVEAADHAHVVNDFAGWGKSVSTAVGWFRCADILEVTQYRGSQVEVETWLFLAEQDRLEAQAACTL